MDVPQISGMIRLSLSKPSPKQLRPGSGSRTAEIRTGRSAEPVGLIMNLKSNLLQLVRMHSCMVCTEEQFATRCEGYAKVCLRTTAITTIGCSQRLFTHDCRVQFCLLTIRGSFRSLG